MYINFFKQELSMAEVDTGLFVQFWAKSLCGLVLCRVWRIFCYGLSRILDPGVQLCCKYCLNLHEILISFISFLATSIVCIKSLHFFLLIVLFHNCADCYMHLAYSDSTFLIAHLNTQKQQIWIFLYRLIHTYRFLEIAGLLHTFLSQSWQFQLLYLL